MAVSVYKIGDTPVVAPINLKPSAISAGVWNTQLISSFDREMFKPVYLPNAVNRHPRTDKFFFADLIKYLGFQIPVVAGENGEYGHFEKDRTVQALVVSEDGYAGAGGDGAAITFQLDPSTVYTGSNGIKSSYARTKDILHFQINHTTFVNAWVTGISQAPMGTLEITCVPNDASVDLISLLGGVGQGAGNTIAVISNANAEGSKQRRGINSRWATYKNQLQIIKDDDSKTGSSYVRAYQIQEFPFEFDGQKMVSYEVLGAEEAERRLKLSRDGAIAFGTLNDNYFENDASVVEPDLEGIAVRTTQGLYPFVAQNGNTNPYTVGAFGMSDFDQTNDLLDAEAAPYNYAWTYGAPFGQELREVLKDYVGTDSENKYVSGELYGNLTPDESNALAVAVGFQSVSLMPSPRKYHFKYVTSFDDPEMLGGASYTYRNMYLLMPIGTFKNQATTASMNEQFGAEYNGAEMPYWGYVYAKKGSYTREVEIFSTGSAGEQLVKKPTDDFDVSRIHFRGEFGGWGASANLFVLGHPAIETSSSSV
jgi:hypothetical protein